MPTDANTLAANSTCIWRCIPDGLKIAALISLFANAAGVTLDAAGIKTLIDQAKCINCEIPRGLQVAALISLFASGGVSPTPTPPAPCVNLIPDGATYNLSGNYVFIVSVGAFNVPLTQGGSYVLTWGASESSITIPPGGGSPFGTIPSPGTGSLTFVAGEQTPFFSIQLHGSVGQPVTATICAI